MKKSIIFRKNKYSKSSKSTKITQLTSVFKVKNHSSYSATFSTQTKITIAIIIQHYIKTARFRDRNT